MFECDSVVRRTRSLVRRVVAVTTLLGTVMLAASCGDPEGLISRSIYTSAAQGPGTRVRLIDLMPFAFERMWIFAPDAPVAAIRDSLGPAAAELPAERLQARGDSTLLIFVRGSRVLFTIPHPPSLGVFHDDAVSRSYTPDEAVFLVDSASTPARTILRRAPAP